MLKVALSSIELPRQRSVAIAASMSRTEEVLGGSQRLSMQSVHDLLESGEEPEALRRDESISQNTGLPLSG